MFGIVFVLILICLLKVLCGRPSKRTRWDLEAPSFANDSNSSLSYTRNNGSGSNTRSAFVVADNSAYNYDVNKICKRQHYIHRFLNLYQSNLIPFLSRCH